MKKRPKSDPPDFELRKYELDREHELELNKFAHALEIERLKILQLVNGGAFTVLVAFSPHLMGISGGARMLGLAAALIWVLGLWAAARATQVQVEAQASFNQGYRYRRNAVEWRRFMETLQDYGRVARRAGPPKRTTELPLDDESYDRWAREAYLAGIAKAGEVKRWAMASVALFMLGAVALTVSIGLAEPVRPAPLEKSSL